MAAKTGLISAGAGFEWLRSSSRHRGRTQSSPDTCPLLVTAHRRATTGSVSYYPDEGAPTGDVPPLPPPDSQPWPDKPKPLPDTRPPDTRRPDTRPADKPPVKQDTTVPKKDTGPLPDHPVVISDSGQPVVIDLAPMEASAAADLPPASEGGGSNNAGKLEGGCGCSVAGPSSPAGLLLVLGLLWSVRLFRRRRP